MLIVLSLLAVAILYDAAMPMRNGLILWGGGVLVVALAAMCFVREFRRPRDGGRQDQPGASFRSTGRLVGFAVLGAFVLSRLVSDWPRWLGFGISRPALEAKVREYQGGSSATLFSSPKPSWAGIYRVVDVCEGSEGSVTLLVETGPSTFVDRSGFEYDPSDSGTTGPFERIAPCWYSCED